MLCIYLCCLFLFHTFDIFSVSLRLLYLLLSLLIFVGVLYYHDLPLTCLGFCLSFLLLFLFKTCVGAR